MSVGMRGPWTVATTAALDEIPETTGIYEVRSRCDGDIVDIDFAGARETFGLRSALVSAVGTGGDGSLEFRYEQHVLYMTRFLEVVLEFRSRHGGDGPQRVALRHPEITGRITPY